MVLDTVHAVFWWEGAYTHHDDGTGIYGPGSLAAAPVVNLGWNWMLCTLFSAGMGSPS